jgi:anti-sigma-K factor RskA
MLFDDLSLRVRILLGLVLPPILTVICWFVGRRIARKHHEPVPEWNSSGFWTLVVAAYIFFVLAIYSSRFFAGASHADPYNQLVQ